MGWDSETTASGGIEPMKTAAPLPAMPLSTLTREEPQWINVAEVVRLLGVPCETRILTNSATKTLNGVSLPGVQPIATRRRTRTRQAGRRGSVYMAVVGSSLIVSALACCGLLLARVQGRMASDVNDGLAARSYAEAAVELGRLWMRQDANWRTNRPHGAWATNQPIGWGTFSLVVTDPLDGNLGNRPHDAVRLTATGIRGNARHVLEVTLQASPVPLPALHYALHTAGQLHIEPGNSLTANAAIVSTNSSLRNEGTITGSVEADSAWAVGVVTGTLALGAGSKALPSSGVADKYAALGTEIPASSTLQLAVLAPGYNPWGTPNPDGVYVIRPGGDLTIRNLRIHGTLVVILPYGSKVTVEESVLIHASRPDYPALIVRGDAVFQYDSTSASLSESLLATNFNPVGAAYNGQENLNTSDTYPSEIQGLVHVTDSVVLDRSALIRGALLGGSTNWFDAVDCRDANVIVYDPNLYAHPPQWYTTEVRMAPQLGSWKQLVE
jgi:hypothetical protein